MILALDQGNGVQVIIKNDGIVETMEEMIAIIKGVKDHITNIADEDLADYAIAYVGRMAFAETDEERHKHTEEFYKWLDEVGD